MAKEIVRDVLGDIIEVVKKTKVPRLPRCIEDMTSSFAFGESLTLDDLLEAIKKNDILETSKEKFTNMVAAAYKKAFGRSTNKFPLNFWGQMEQHIGRSCGITDQKFPFYSIYVFLKQMQGEEV